MWIDGLFLLLPAFVTLTQHRQCVRLDWVGRRGVGGTEEGGREGGKREEGRTKDQLLP